MEFTFFWEDTTDKTLVNKCIHTFISETGRCYEESKVGWCVREWLGAVLGEELNEDRSEEAAPTTWRAGVPEPGSGIDNSKAPGGDSLGSFNEQQWLLSPEPLN